MGPACDSPRLNAVERLHERDVADTYRWLEDDRSAECGAWLDDQAEKYERHRATWRGRTAWAVRLSEAFVQGSRLAPLSSPPVWRGRRRFFAQASAGRELAALMVADGDEEARVLLDPLLVDSTGRTTLDAWRPSPTGRLVACQLSHQGDERPWLQTLDERGRQTGAPLRPGRMTPVAWLADDKGFYYLTTSAGGGRQVRLHQIGADPGSDPEVFTTDLPHLSVVTAPGGPLIMITAAPGATSGNVLWLAPLPDRPGHRLHPIQIHDGTGDGSRAALKFAPDGSIYAITDSAAPTGDCAAWIPTGRTPRYGTPWSPRPAGASFPTVRC